MGIHLERGRQLFRLKKWGEAEKEFRRELGEDPHDAETHAMLALCLSQLEKFEEATDEGRKAVHLAPDHPGGFYALASVYFDRHHMDEAAEAIQEAIRLDPQDADYHALLAAVRYDQRRWPEALEGAERGLACEPEHVNCTNLRAMSLIKLNRRDEAGATIEEALAQDPENDVTHANMGWALLEKGDTKKALEHFRESLRLNPESDWARHGIVEALKSRYLIYSLMLKYFFFMSKLSRQWQWGIVIGALIIYQILYRVAEKYPSTAPYLWPVMGVYLAFVFLSWLAVPLFNLALRLNRFGRHALSREQTVASNWIGGSLLLAVALVGVWLGTGDELWLAAALFSAILTIPLSGAFNCSEGWPRRTMLIYTAALATLMVVLLVLPENPAMMRVVEGLTILVVLGVVASPWVANAMAMQRPRR